MRPQASWLPALRLNRHGDSRSQPFLLFSLSTARRHCLVASVLEATVFDFLQLWVLCTLFSGNSGGYNRLVESGSRFLGRYISSLMDPVSPLVFHGHGPGLGRSFPGSSIFWDLPTAAPLSIGI